MLNFLSVIPLAAIDITNDNVRRISAYNLIYNNWRVFVDGLNDLASNYQLLTASVDDSFELGDDHPDLINDPILRKTYDFERFILDKGFRIGITEMNALN